MKTEDLKFNDLTSKGQFNKCTSPIAPLTTEQIKALTSTCKTTESALDKAIKSLKDTLDKQNNKKERFWAT
jgi:flagellar capping protein FliD